VYTDTAVRHVLMRQGVVGIKVSIFLPQDLTGVNGPKIPLDDVVTIMEPKEELTPAAMLANQQAYAAQAAAAMMAPEIVEQVDPAEAAGY
jgi:small subunit ribosomal protein S3e